MPYFSTICTQSISQSVYVKHGKGCEDKFVDPEEMLLPCPSASVRGIDGLLLPPFLCVRGL